MGTNGEWSDENYDSSEGGSADYLDQGSQPLQPQSLIQESRVILKEQKKYS